MRSLMLCLLALTTAPAAQLVLEGVAGPGRGKHVVFLAGDEEYRSEEALPMLARLLAVRHGFNASVCFSLAKDGSIDPDAQGSLGMAEALDRADLIVVQLRFRAWDDATMRKFVAAYERGVPIVALRTSTHAFAYPRGSKSEFAKYSWDSREWPGGFGKQVLGETWVAHHGHHKVEATRGIVEPANASHPILRGVTDVFADTDVYAASPPADATVLLRGQVLRGMQPSDPPVTGKKNEPMQPIAWTRSVQNAAGKTNQIMCTTMGAATDLQSAGVRRLVVNAIYWGLGMEVPAQADVTPVGDYAPSNYDFGGWRRGLRPEMYALSSPTSTPLPRWQPLSGERVALVGGGLAVRLAESGHLEAALHGRFASQRLVVRGFGWPADQVDRQQRPDDYTSIDDPLAAFAPDTFVCCFGTNEAFAGEAKVGEFLGAYERWLDETSRRYGKDGAAPKFVLLGPAAAEASGDPLLPATEPRNAALRAYSAAIAKLARKRGAPFVELFGPTAARFAAEAGAQFTTRNQQLADAGCALVAELAEIALFGDTPARDANAFARLRAAVVDKAWVHANDYRMVNGWYVYGGRRTHDTQTFPTEFKKVRAMVAARDAHVWALAAGENSAGPDDAKTGGLFVPQTMFGANAYSEPKELRFASATESAAAMRVAEGLEVKPFASEAEFKELANPVQLNFDDRGRLWVAVMPTYPQWQPGNPKPNDKLLIFEDRDNDGRADVCKVFYDRLHCPTGFEFFAGGVLVTDQPRLIFLKDTDGDDRADHVETVIDGWASDDTHHTIGAFEWSPGGLLHMLEGVHMSTTLETPWGAVRNKGPAGSWVLDPRRLRVRYFQTPGYGNPWTYVFDGRGNGIVGDGTSGQQHFDSLLNGAQFNGRRGPPTVFDNQGMRPVIGSEFLISRHLPDAVQGQMIYACVINMHGLTRFAVRDDGAGLGGERVPDLLASDDAMFRPADPQIGPDGAVWFADWCNPLIGHMQYSQRDPNRDKVHGRLFRLVAKGRPLLTPVTQHGKATSEVVEQLREPEPRTRYRARRALRARPTAETLAALTAWLPTIAADPQAEWLRVEALWVQQGHAALDRQLLGQCLAAKSADARVAAVRVVADLHGQLADAFALLAPMARDAHPRVRLEAVRALSFFPTKEAVVAALAATEQPNDKWLDYVLDATLAALAPVWLPAFAAGEKLAADGTPAAQRLANHDATKGAVARANELLKKANDRSTPLPERRRQMTALAEMPGNAGRGRDVFGRICIACHRVGEQGMLIGPELTDVAKRLPLADMAESLFEPNAKIDPKWAVTSIKLNSGDTTAGFVIAEDAKSLTLRLPDSTTKVFAVADIGKRETLATSTMPEGLTQTLSAGELVDLLAYLKTLR
jgi:putative heme-binding domain-containing protein